MSRLRLIENCGGICAIALSFEGRISVGRFTSVLLSLTSPATAESFEIDGSQHAERASDVARTRRLEADGYRVVRFWNNDVLSNIDGVLNAILDALSTPTPDPSPQGGGEK